MLHERSKRGCLEAEAHDAIEWDGLVWRQQPHSTSISMAHSTSQKRSMGPGPEYERLRAHGPKAPRIQAKAHGPEPMCPCATRLSSQGPNVSWAREPMCSGPIVLQAKGSWAQGRPVHTATLALSLPTALGPGLGAAWVTTVLQDVSKML